MLNISQFLSKKCVPCSNKTPKLEQEQINAYLDSLPNWQLKENKLVREIKLKDFQESLSQANLIGQIAESENHHPDLHIAWGLLEIRIYTHSINALSENDFILAAKIDKALSRNN